MKNAVLLHGIFAERIDGVLIANIPLCNPNHEGNWMGWTKKQLEARGFAVTCPVIVDVWNATWQQWKDELDKVQMTEETILVGLSGGGYALLRYLGESGKKVKKVILVAPGAPVEDQGAESEFPHKAEFYAYPITPQLKAQIQDQVVEFVSNDADFILRSVEMYKNLLDAKVIKLENRGHFSFLIKEFPELLDEILR